MSANMLNSLAIVALAITQIIQANWLKNLSRRITALRYDRERLER